MPGDEYYFDLPPAEYAAELQKPSFFEVNKTKCVIALVVVVGVVILSQEGSPVRAGLRARPDSLQLASP